MDEIKLETLEGKWYINLTNFPMWLKGDITGPTFNYSLEKRGNITGLNDQVIYFKNDKEKLISGFDTPVNDSNKAFVWQGKGLLSLLKSKWEIICLDISENWAIIHFEKTLFTPEGYDVISRKSQLEESTLKNINKKLAELSISTKLQML